jgi:HlyD family secretion protein
VNASSPRWIWPAAFLVLIPVVLGLLRKRSDREPLLTAAAARRSFTVSVATVGTLDAAESQAVYSRIKGDKGKIIFLIAEGARVAEGSVLVRFDPTSLEEEVRKLAAQAREASGIVETLTQAVEWEKAQGEKEKRVAEFEIRIAELDLQKLEKGEGPRELALLEGALAEAERGCQDARGYLKDLEGLAGKGYSNPAEIAQAGVKEEEMRKKSESARLQLESYRDYVLPAQLAMARAQVERAKMLLAQTEKSAGFTVGKALASRRKASAALEAAEASLEIARGELGKTVIVAPAAGIAVFREEFRQGEKRKPRVGDTVWENQPLLYLPDLSAMVARTLVREFDLDKIAVGEKARVKVDAYPASEFTGRVAAIGIVAEKRYELQTSEQYFEVTAALDGSDERLRPGMTARVEIFSGPSADALCVPVAALFERAGKTVCYLDLGRSYEAREVRPGRQNEDLVEIRDGLKEGDEVCLAAPPESEIRMTTALE